MTDDWEEGRAAFASAVPRASTAGRRRDVLEQSRNRRRRSLAPREAPGRDAALARVQALKAALDDAGLTKDDLDGLLTMPGTTSPEGPKRYLTLGGHLGINPSLTGSLVMGGATAGALIQQAALAIDAGLANVVACVFSDTARTGGSKFDAPAGRGDSWGISGMFGNAANSAMTAQRHRALYGTTSEQLGWVAVTCASTHRSTRRAVMREPITLEDHQASRRSSTRCGCWTAA